MQQLLHLLSSHTYLAGKKTIFAKVKGLFRKEQAPSSSAAVGKAPVQALPLSVSESKEIAELVHAWVRGKGYRLPHRTIAEAASNIGTNSVMLHRYFINCMGQDFRAWRTALRIEDAKRLLIEEPSLSCAEVARIVGIHDRSNFLRQFVLLTGCTPDQWRKKQQA